MAQIARSLTAAKAGFLFKRAIVRPYSDGTRTAKKGTAARRCKHSGALLGPVLRH